MSGFDTNLIHAVPILGDQPVLPGGADNPSEAERQFFDFLMQYRIGGQFIYR